MINVSIPDSAAGTEGRNVVTDRSRQRSPLAMMVLALLAEEPMHAYRMHELIKARGKDTVVNVAQRNSVYQTISRLLRSGLIRVQKTLRDEGRPERIVYEISEDGSATLRMWLEAMIAVPSNEYPEFPAALAFLPLLTPREARHQLEARAAALEQLLDRTRIATKAARDAGLPRLFLIEDEYKQAMQRAELVWVRSLIGDLRSGKITWNAKWLRQMAAAFDAHGPE